MTDSVSTGPADGSRLFGSSSETRGDHSLLRCDSVSRVYHRDGARGRLFNRGRQSRSRHVTALSDVTLEFSPGKVTVIAGPSGSGKSTLLHLLAALDVPTDGQVFLDGIDTTALSERDRTALRRRRVGIVFQRFHLLPSLTARSNVALPLIEEGLSKQRRHDRAETLLEAVGLGNRVDHRPFELSGGEQQRVAIARSLVNEPAVLLADEPTGELDSETGARILSLLDELASDRVVVVASHDPAVIERGDRVIRLADGRVVRDG